MFSVRGLDNLKKKIERQQDGLDRYDRLFADYALDAAATLENHLRNEAPRGKTGTLQKLRLGLDKRANRYVVFVINPPDYYAMVLHGTRPHTVKPKNRSVLKFESSGTVFARQVNHPGTKANNFKLRAIQQAKPELRQLLAKFKKQVLG